MWANMAIDGGLSLLKNGVAYSNAKETAETQRAWQKYKNAMTRMADAMNQNALTVNENLARERAIKAKFEIGRSEHLTLGEAEVSAAAADTGGRSVNAVMFDLERNADVARNKVDADLEAQRLQIDHQREASAWQAATQIDYSPIPMPNKATYMLNFATDVTKSYYRHK
jgi:hypothetical protein